MTSIQEPLHDHYGRLTDTGWSGLRERLKQAAQAGVPLALEDVRDLDKLVASLESKMNVRVMSQGYNFIVGQQGDVQALTAGDQFYEEAGLQLDMSGWQMIDDSTDPEKLEQESWLSRWRWFPQSRPADYEMVVTKTPGGQMAYDWMEPGRHADKGVGNISYFAENLGRPQFWMPREEFERLAPAWAKDSVAPLHSQPCPPATTQDPS